MKNIMTDEELSKIWVLTDALINNPRDYVRLFNKTMEYSQNCSSEFSNTIKIIENSFVRYNPISKKDVVKMLKKLDNKTQYFFNICLK